MHRRRDHLSFRVRLIYIYNLPSVGLQETDVGCFLLLTSTLLSLVKLSHLNGSYDVRLDDSLCCPFGLSRYVIRLDM